MLLLLQLLLGITILNSILHTTQCIVLLLLLLLLWRAILLHEHLVICLCCRCLSVLLVAIGGRGLRWSGGPLLLLLVLSLEKKTN